MISEGFKDASGIDAVGSSGYFRHQWEVVTQSRSQGATYLSAPFDSLSDWAVSVGGTASAVIYTPTHIDPAVGNSLKLSSGSQQQSLCMVTKTLANLPSSFGVMMHIAMDTIGTQFPDCAVFVANNTVNGKNLELLLIEGAILCHQDGTYKLLSSHSPTYFCENWFEVKDNGNGTHTVSIYQGTQLVNAVTGVMPNGTNPGMVMLQQNSGASPNRSYSVAQLNIGVTQLADNMTLKGAAFQTKFNATAAHFRLLVEDVSLSLVNGTDLLAKLTIGGVVYPLTLVESASPYLGVIDYTKPVRAFSATVPLSIPQGTAVSWTVDILNAKLSAVHNVGVDFTSIY